MCHFIQNNAKNNTITFITTSQQQQQQQQQECNTLFIKTTLRTTLLFIFNDV